MLRKVSTALLADRGQSTAADNENKSAARSNVATRSGELQGRRSNSPGVAPRSAFEIVRESGSPEPLLAQDSSSALPEDANQMNAADETGSSASLPSFDSVSELPDETDESPKIVGRTDSPESFGNLLGVSAVPASSSLPKNVGETGSAPSLLSLDSVSAMPDSATQPTAAELASGLFSESKLVALVKSPKDRCFDAAVEVQAWLNKRQVKNHVTALLAWKGATDILPDNHVIVRAEVDGEMYAIDPTAGQFKNLQAMMVDVDKWEALMRTAYPGRAVVSADFKNVSQAKIHMGSAYKGGPLSFQNGRTLNSPQWHQRILRNPVAMKELERKLAQD